MKKISLLAIAKLGNEWSDVTGGNGENVSFPLWDFKVVPEFIGLLGSNYKGTSKKNNLPYFRYNVYSSEHGKPFAIFASKVLEDKLKDIPPGTTIKIKFMGTQPGKRYYIFDVKQNTSIPLNPGWEKTCIEQLKALNANGAQPQNTSYQAPAPGANLAPPAGVANDGFDDLPF